MKNIYSFLNETVQKFPNKLALVYKDKKYTYKQLQEIVDKIINYIGNVAGNQDVICLYMKNSDSWIASYFGILGAGCICNPIGLRISDENLDYQIKFSNPKALIVSEELLEKCKRLGLDKLTKIIVFDEMIVESAESLSMINRNLEGAKYSDEKYSTIMYTSGSTGIQKAIKLPHSVVYNATINILDYLKINYDDIYYAILPFSHSFGLGNIHCIFKVGGTVVVADNTINLRKILHEIVFYKATFFAAVPLTLKTLVDNFLSEFIEAGESLRIICTNTGPMQPSIIKSILKNLLKTFFYTYYGLTEASRSTFICFNLYPDKIGSVGKPSPNVKIKTISDSGRDCFTNELGEICIYGNHLVSEYWKNKEATKKSFSEGWIYTGDYGFFDKDNFLYVKGRKDDVVNIAGEKVSLAEVDKILLELDFVKDAASIEIENPNTEWSIKSFIVLDEEYFGKEREEDKEKDKEKGKEKDNYKITKEIISYCKNKLDNYKTPTRIDFVESIPRTDSGKLKRNVLRMGK